MKLPGQANGPAFLCAWLHTAAGIIFQKANLMLSILLLLTDWWVPPCILTPGALIKSPPLTGGTHILAPLPPQSLLEHRPLHPPNAGANLYRHSHRAHRAMSVVLQTSQVTFFRWETWGPKMPDTMPRFWNSMGTQATWLQGLSSYPYSFLLLAQRVLH